MVASQLLLRPQLLVITGSLHEVVTVAAMVAGTVAAMVVGTVAGTAQGTPDQALRITTLGDDTLAQAT